MNLNTSPLEFLDLSKYGIYNSVYIKRDDLIHPIVSGNKWRKLKENFSYFESLNFDGIVSLGGAYSSHILSLSYTCFQKNIPCTLIIRGEEPKIKNDILLQCLDYGAKIHYLSRSNYSNKKFINEFCSLNYPSFLFIPEGGANKHGILGCRQIIKEINVDFDEIYCEVGTGATLSGISSVLANNQKVNGIVVLKGAKKIDESIKKNYFSSMGEAIKNNWNLIHDYHFGGYAKHNIYLINFMRDFYIKTGIKTDPIYSGKLFYALVDILQKYPKERKKKILALHSGGLSGISGFEKRYNIKIFN